MTQESKGIKESKESKETTTKKSLSRRQMLTWSGGLAAAAVVGAGVGYGASEFLKPAAPPPTPPPSFKPPLSPEVQDRVNAIIKSYVDKHAGEAEVATSATNLQGGGLTKVRIKNGKLTSVAPWDGGIHPHTGREDAYCSQDDILLGNVQWRGPILSYALPASINSPDRLLYPMKRAPGEKRADLNGRFVRISWEEALDTIANKMKEVKAKYGPYSIYGGSASPSTADPRGTAPLLYATGGTLARYMNAAVGGFGHTSGAHEGLACNTVFGDDSGSGEGADADNGSKIREDGDICDILNTKFIVSWGNDPATTGPIPWQHVSYYYTLAHEKKIPHIYIGPIYQMTAETLADQWIPIRHGTDITMMLAVANVLFKENLVDQAFIDKFVEPTGLAKWKDYVLGNTAGPDGKIDRTPEWAEKICGVPADTIRAFARLYGSYHGYSKKNPAWLMFSSTGARQAQGDNPVRGALCLQLITGNIGIPGGNLSFSHYSSYHSKRGSFRTVGPAASWNRKGVPTPEKLPGQLTTPGTCPCFFKYWKVNDAVLLSQKVRDGQMKAEEYNRLVGSKFDNPVMNMQFMWNDSSSSANNPISIGGPPDVNQTLKRIRATEMYVASHRRWSSEIKASDIALPTMEYYEEDRGVSSGGFSGNSYQPKLLEPQGEARPTEWAIAEVAKRLGFLDLYSPSYVGKTYADFEGLKAKAQEDGYNSWLTSPINKKCFIDNGVVHPPTIQEFAKQVYNFVPSDMLQLGKPGRYTTALQQAIEIGDQVVRGKKGTPFWTESGKAEIYCNYFATTDLNKTKYGGPVNPMPMWGDADKPYVPYSPLDPKAKGPYPLTLGSSHPRHRGNVGAEDTNPQMRDVYRHSIWISLADAKARGIKDDDLVRVYNELGEMVIPAYVTSRIVAGDVHIYGVTNFEPNKAGVDRRGSEVVLHHSDTHSALHEPYLSLVEVEKY